MSLRCAIAAVLAATCTANRPGEQVVAPPPADASPPRAAGGSSPSGSIEELLGLHSSEPPEVLAGYRIGDEAREVRRRVVAAGVVGDARAIAAEGRIRHVVVELLPDSDDGSGAEQHRLIAGWLERMRARWGEPMSRHGRLGWRGARFQLVAAEYGGFLRGTPSLVLDLLPAGERHVCGKEDGFAEFFARFRRAVKRKDAAAIAAMIDQSRETQPDMLVCDDASADSWIACAVGTMARLPGQPTCNVSQEIYLWATPGETLGGLLFTFWRRDDRAWRVAGPRALGHDDDADPMAP